MCRIKGGEVSAHGVLRQSGDVANIKTVCHPSNRGLWLPADVRSLRAPRGRVQTDRRAP